MADYLQLHSYGSGELLILELHHILNVGGLVAFIQERGYLWSCSAGLLLLSYQHIILLNPNASLDYSILKLQVIAVSIWRLNGCDLIYVFVILDLSLLVCVVDGIEQALINRSLIEDDRVLLVEPIVYHIGDY